QPDAALVQKLEAAHGLLAERFAFCQTMPLEDFLSVAESLRASGYRPVRFRPYRCATAVSAVAGGTADTAVAPNKNKEVLVAAVWTRDGQDWHLVQGLSAEELRRQDADKRKQAFQPVDVADYLLGGKEQYAALWLKSASDAPETQLEVGL